MAGRKLLVRHALSGANLEGVIQGQTNTPLKPGYKTSVDKFADMVISQEHLAPQPADVYVVCSPLDRAYYTAERIHRGLTDRRVQAELRILHGLTERGAGILEGKTYADAIPDIQDAIKSSGKSVPTIEPNARGIYPYLYLLNNIPGGEKHEVLRERLSYALGQIEQLRGIVIIVGHGISGNNHLKNLMTDQDILGNPQKPYQHLDNLAVVRLDKGANRRYIAAEPYGPPNGNGAVSGGSLIEATSNR